jgi:pimeloyl-ACP methyl ester carboxylesterase
MSSGRTGDRHIQPARFHNGAHAMSTVTSPDGTVIDYDRYGDGPAVIFIGGAAALCTNSSGADIALAAASTGVGVAALALYEPPFIAGRSFTTHLAALRSLLADGNNDEAMRYNLTSVIGLPAEAVDEMARAPWWAAMVAAAPTLVYDHAATHEINLDPDWRARWAKVTVPTIVCSGDQTFPGLAEAADAVAAALPNASRRILPGQGHRPAPEAIVPVLAEFLRS